MSKYPKEDESVDDYVARRMSEKHDKKGNKHLKKLTSDYLLPDEAILAWAPAFRDGTTFEGVAALTSARIIFYRSGALSVKLEPIPVNKISTVDSNRGVISLDATIHTSHDSLKLRFVDKPRGEELLRALQEVMQMPVKTVETHLATSHANEKSYDDPLIQLAKLGELREAGVLNEDEFAAKKAELLSRI